MIASGLRSLLKECLLRGLGSSVAIRAKVRKIAASRALTILNLHRVAPHDESSYPPLDPALFDYLLRFVKDRFDVVTFAEASVPSMSKRPRLILSFDDGYRDFYTVAAPLLAEHGLRANQNVVPELIETGLPPLNVHLQDFVGRAPIAAVNALDIPGFSYRRPVASRFHFGTAVSEFIKNRPIAEQRILGEALLPQIRGVAEFTPTSMMTAQQVREMAGRHEIGAHSYSHASMASESSDYLGADIERCRSYFADRLGLPLTLYALPNGSFRDEQVRILREAGMKHILLVGEDFTPSGSDLYRRFTFAAYSRSEVRFRATGSYKWPGR